MQAKLVNQQAVLTFNLVEGRLLRQVLQTVREHYRLKPSELEGAIGAVWYSTQGCRKARMTPEETAEWVEALHAVKLSHLHLLDQALEQLHNPQDGKPVIRLRYEDVPTFLTIINDHRLLSAARGEIGEQEMNLRSFRTINRLPPPKQAALYEVHLLAYVMEQLLHLLEEPSAEH